jgi:hypothetical protein
MVLPIKLTARQRAFLVKLVELYGEHRRPVHYSDVGDALGVNRFSAYDMLKVLEKKGLALSTYALTAEHSGPGRSLVMFSPTAQALQIVDQGGGGLGDEWSTMRDRILARLREAREANYHDILDDLLAHLPDAKTPLIYCAEMIGILLLNMRRAIPGPDSRIRSLSPFRVLAALRTEDGEAELEALAGLSMGTTLAADDESRLSLTQRLLGQARRYQTTVAHLGAEARSALGQFLEEALEALD